ncbi:hypothetical protein HMPREF0204_11846 [Chryseobacterium gleum ATCC 35910]|uniref:Uncharacterized protein n=1 Tax=Chryseobacterium gleum ATCC 35910 TaxID=525257 RepID=A0ABP2IRK3_CHRGE|nr:hypothetical protein HMPREF0204_11846 [Chryseobacterium gleum ATCC 35910]
MGIDSRTDKKKPQQFAKVYLNTNIKSLIFLSKRLILIIVV